MAVKTFVLGVFIPSFIHYLSSGGYKGIIPLAGFGAERQNDQKISSPSPFHETSLFKELQGYHTLGGIGAEPQYAFLFLAIIPCLILPCLYR